MRDEQTGLPDSERAALGGAAQHGVDELGRSRRRRLALGSGAVAVVVLAALTGAILLPGLLRSDPTATATSPTPSASASERVEPTQTSTPSETPESEGPVPDANDPASWVVSNEGIGPFRVGMLFNDAAQLVVGRSDCGRGEPEPPVYVGYDHRLWIIGAEDEPAISPELEVVEWTSMSGPTPDLRATPRSAEGIGVGSTEAEVRAAYPTAIEVERNGLHLQVGRMYFGLSEGVVTDLGVTATDIPYEFCG